MSSFRFDSLLVGMMSPSLQFLGIERPSSRTSLGICFIDKDSSRGCVETPSESIMSLNLCVGILQGPGSKRLMHKYTNHSKTHIFHVLSKT